MDLQQTRLLIVDDNADIHDDYRKILELPQDTSDLDSLTALMTGEPQPEPPQQVPVRIDSAFQGSDALVLVERSVAEGEPYSLAFVDMRMPPGWDGIMTIKKLWEADPCLQVVICSAYSDRAWEDLAADLGHSDQMRIMRKPFEVTEVKEIRDKMVARS